MNAYTILIFLSGLVIFSYLFDLFAKRTRLPSVLLLLALGIGIRALADAWGHSFPQVAMVLPTLGNIGLILIVFEGALELEYERSKRPMIRKAFATALFLLLLTTAGIAAVLHYLTDAAVLTCIANAVPLSVISSAVAIPSASGLPADRKEFVVYESTFSDILGIILFNFIVTNTTFGMQAFGGLGLEIFGVLALSAVFSMALLWLLGRIKHHVKFFLILAILVMVYGVGKQFHLSSLVVVLAFGMFLANAHQLPFAWFKRRFMYTDFSKDIEQFHSLSSESAFLIRTFFFVLFGYSVVVAEVVQREVLILGAALLVVTYLLRALFLKLAVRLDLQPLLYITPRGLISILLYLSLPEHLRMPEVGMGLLFVLVLATCFIMAMGLLGARGLVRSLGDLGDPSK
ncbi:MAG: cation:proton antiporter [Flavobacteriales bacterium]